MSLGAFVRAPHDMCLRGSVMKKSILSLILSAVLVMTMAPCIVSADNPENPYAMPSSACREGEAYEAVVPAAERNSDSEENSVASNDAENPSGTDAENSSVNDAVNPSENADLPESPDSVLGAPSVLASGYCGTTEDGKDGKNI